MKHLGLITVLVLAVLSCSQALASDTPAGEPTGPSPETLDIDVAQTDLIIGSTAQLSVTATFDDDSSANVDGSPSLRFISTNESVVTVDAAGLVTATGFGRAEVIATLSGPEESFAAASVEFSATVAGDSDGDGIPTDYEQGNGLNPENPLDGEEDADLDGLPNRQEFNLGTKANDENTDSDGANDGAEVTGGTDPLVFDVPVPENLIIARLDETCTVNILNRTARVAEDGTFAIFNLPASTMLVRARAVCERDGLTIEGTSDFFEVQPGVPQQIPPMTFAVHVPTIETMDASVAPVELAEEGATAQITVNANFSDGSERNVTAASEGTAYTSSNGGIATVSDNGLVTANSSGAAIINIVNDGVFTSVRLVVNLGDDDDDDGMPNDYETINGFNPDSAADATLDQDVNEFGAPTPDGLTNLQEFEAGTDPLRSDTDGDSLLDGAEEALGADPLRADTDLDGVGDAQEPAGNFDEDGFTNVRDPDSDNDGIPDGVEFQITGTITNLSPDGDSDGDQIPDGEEIELGTNPIDSDSDNDGLTDFEEVSNDTDPLVADRDAPVVAFVFPLPGTPLVQGETLPIEVAVTDDGRVPAISLQFLADGEPIEQVTEKNFGEADSHVQEYVVPVDASSVELEVMATDTAGNVGSTGAIEYEVGPDPLTTVTGVVLDQDENLVANAEVSIYGGEFTGITNANGEFTIANVTTIDGRIVASAEIQAGDVQLSGRSAAVLPVRGGITGVGEIRLAPYRYDPEIGTRYFLSDDTFQEFPFQNGFTFTYFGTTYNSAFVSSNGYITFGSGDGSYSPVDPNEVTGQQPRIAAFFTDVLPSVLVVPESGLYVKEESDRFVVTFFRVSLYFESADDTFQTTLYSDGRITFAYNDITPLTADREIAVAISPGAVVEPRLVDYTVDAPFSTTSAEATYEEFGLVSTFDLAGTVIAFVPNVGGGYDVGLFDNSFEPVEPVSLEDLPPPPAK